MDKGWIKLYRELLDRPIWLNSTAEQKVVLIALLLMAGHDTRRWQWKGRNFTCLPGQMVTSLQQIQKRCGKGISIRNIRTALKRFKAMGFLTEETTNVNRLITIANWTSYKQNSPPPKPFR